MLCFGAVLQAGENTAVALESVCFRANLTAASKRFDSESPRPVGGGSNMLRVLGYVVDHFRSESDSD